MSNGIIALLYGILVLFFPEGTMLTIITWFGIIIIIVGVAMLIGAINNQRNNRRYTTDLIWSILTLVIGGLLTFYTQRSIEIFFIVIGIWAFIIGIIQLYLVSKSELESQDKTAFLINGIITLVFGVLLLIYPFTSAKVLITISGIFAIISGAVLIYIAVKIKSLYKELGN